MTMVAISDKTEGKTYFVGSGVETKFIDMVRAIIDVMGRGKYEFCDFPPLLHKIDTRRFACDISRIESDIGWQPQFSLKEGIERTVNYYIKYLNNYRQND